MFEGNGGDSYILWARDLSQPYLKLKVQVMQVTYIVLQTAAEQELECLSKNFTRSTFLPSVARCFHKCSSTRQKLSFPVLLVPSHPDAGLCSRDA